MSESSPPFVLVHGGNVGGWQWQDTARLLRRAGHDVYTPTLTGHGDRAHLEPEGGLSFDVWVDDVVGHIEYEDLHDVVLVGHSLGGMIIPRVACRLPQRMRRVIWMAALVLEDGEPMRAHVERSRAAAGPRGTAWAAANGAEPRKPAAGLSAFRDSGIPSAYVVALRDTSLTPEVCRDFAARLPNSLYREVDASHNLMTSRPALTADVLLELAKLDAPRS